MNVRLLTYLMMIAVLMACTDEAADRDTAYGMQFVSDDYYLVACSDSTGMQRWLFIDSDGQQVGDHDFARAENFSNGLAMVVDDNGLIGYIDTDGKYRIVPRFTAAARYYGNRILACEPDSAIAVYDGDGNRLFTMQQAVSMAVYTDGLARFTDYDGQVGFVDIDGNVVIPPTYDNASIFVNEMAVVSANGGQTVIDKTGKVVIPRLYDRVLLPASNHLYMIVEQGGRWGIINTNGDFVVEPTYSFIDNLPNGYFAVTDDSSLWGLCSPAGDLVVNPKYTKLGYGSVRSRHSYNQELLIATTDGGNYGVIDVKGIVRLPLQYSAVAISGDMILAKTDKLWGAYNTRGITAFGPRFTRLLPYLNGKTALASNERYWGLVDRMGNYVVEPVWSDVNTNEPTAVVYTDLFDMDATVENIVRLLRSLATDMNSSFDHLIDRYGIRQQTAMDDVRRGRGDVRLVYEHPLNGHVRYDMTAEYPVVFDDERTTYVGTETTTMVQYNFVFSRDKADRVPIILERVLAQMGFGDIDHGVTLGTAGGDLQLQYYPSDTDNVISFLCHNLSQTYTEN